MSINVIRRIQEKISQLAGIDLQANEEYPEKTTGNWEKAGNYIFDLRPEFPKSPWGYRLRVIFYSKRFEVHFEPDSYALPLIRNMEKNTAGRMQFSRIAKSLTEKSTRLSMKINDQSVSLEEPDNWISSWRKLEISIEKYSADFNQRDLGSAETQIIEYGSKFFLMVLSLMPIEEVIEEHSSDVEGLPEGSRTRIEVNKYERSPLNRSACITFHGVKCKVCDFTFEEKYGSMGAGFIHVHHVKPVSEVGENYVIDPLKDLIPVCANCHDMLHKDNPPLTVEKLRAIIKKNSDMP